MIEATKLVINHLVLDEFRISEDICTLYFPGFKQLEEPGTYKKTNEIDNLLPKLFNDINETYYQINYSGTGGSGREFSFLNSLEDGILACEYLLKHFKKVNLVCRGWGAIAGSYALSKFCEQLGNIILLTPYCFIPGRERVEYLLNGMFTENFIALKKEDADYYLEEIEEIRSKYSFIENVINIMDRKVFIIAATKDKIIPIQILRETTSMLKNRKYFEVNQGHELERPQEIEEIIKQIITP